MRVMTELHADVTDILPFVDSSRSIPGIYVDLSSVKATWEVGKALFIV